MTTCFGLLISALCLGLGLGGPATPANVSVERPVLVQGNGQTITGTYSGVIFGGDGYAYFSIGTTQMRMKTANFPDPQPAQGSKVTATNCVPDPAGGDWMICQGSLN